jgi:hypothetical protein
VEGNLKSPFRVRWGFLFALVIILQICALGLVFYAHKWLTFGGYGAYAPTQVYLQQTTAKIMEKINRPLNLPSELARWRVTGKWEEPPPFAPGNLFWFAYDSKLDHYTYHFLDSAASAKSDQWQYLLSPFLAPLLEKKKFGHIGERIKNDEGEYYISGHVYESEPRVLALVTDVALYRQTEIPRRFKFALQEYPGLAFAAPAPDSGYSYSQMYILLRDDQSNIVAQLGSPGKADSSRLSRIVSYTESHYSNMLGCTVEMGIPRSTEKLWWWHLRRGFFWMIALWVLTMMLWARAEVRLSKAKKMPRFVG